MMNPRFLKLLIGRTLGYRFWFHLLATGEGYASYRWIQRLERYLIERGRHLKT